MIFRMVGTKIWTDLFFRFVTMPVPAFDRRTDRQTDGHLSHR